MSVDFDLTPSEGQSVPDSPIADLSYRNYSGPLHTRMLRWWTVCSMVMRLTTRKWGFWVIVALTTLPALFYCFRFYISAGVGDIMSFGQPTDYRSMFEGLFDDVQLFVFFAALLTGAGAIAADNRANAMLVYLSKPITKKDYLVGKWMGIFLTVYQVCLLPLLAAWIFGALVLTGPTGIFATDRLMPLRLAVVCIAPAAIHSSVLVGISAWSKSGRMAGALYACLFFVSDAIAGIVYQLTVGPAASFNNSSLGVALGRRLSISGISEGIAYGILRAKDVQRHRLQLAPTEHITVLLPPLWWLVGIAAALCIAFVAAAATRIRAVEVVRG